MYAILVHVRNITKIIPMTWSRNPVLNHVSGCSNDASIEIFRSNVDHQLEY